MCARAHLPLLSQQASGKFAQELVFKRRLGKNLVCAYSKPTGTISFPQYLQRYVVKAKMVAWQALSPAQKEVWETRADALGGTWSGYTLFLHEYAMPLPPVEPGDVPYGDAAGAWQPLNKGNDGDVLTLAGGFPSWAPAAGGVTEEAVCFYDEFLESALDWMWVSFGTSANKTIVVSGSSATISVAEGTDARHDNATYNEPGFWTGPWDGAHEFTVKITGLTLGRKTSAALNVSIQPTTGCAANTTARIAIGKTVGDQVYIQASNPQVAASDAVNMALPDTIYLRIRAIVARQFNRFWYFYSTDGTTWNQMMVGATPFCNPSQAYPGENPYVPLLEVYNESDGGNYHAVSAAFNWIKITRPLGRRT